MSFIVNSSRLILRVEDDSIAPRALTFYQENKTYFEPFEPTRPDAFYTLEYQQAAAEYGGQSQLQNLSPQQWQLYRPLLQNI